MEQINCSLKSREDVPMIRMTKRLPDGWPIMDCQSCELNKLSSCTALACRNRLKDRLADYEDAIFAERDPRDAEQTIQRLQAELAAARGERDIVTKRMVKLEQENAALKKGNKVPCHMCLNARVDPDLTDENDLSYHGVGEAEKGFRFLVSSGARKPLQILFERWNGNQWNTIGIYEPSHCPNCGRELSEYQKKGKRV